jgi:hypothetical protein
VKVSLTIEPKILQTDHRLNHFTTHARLRRASHSTPPTCSPASRAAAASNAVRAT